MRFPLRLALVGLAAAGLSGCVTPVREVRLPPPSSPAPPAETRVVRVIVPKPVKCVPEDLGAAPAYPDSDAALREAGGAADRYQLLAAGRILRQQRLQKLEDVVRRCRNAAR